MDQDLDKMGEDQLRGEILRLRGAIRYHRDQKMHDRCHVDDNRLYRLLPELTQADFSLPPEEEFFSECRLYYRRCVENGENGIESENDCG
jgi:hypothetical protein